MRENQRGRRNLSPDAFKLALGRRYNRTKKSVGGDYTSQAAKDQNELKLNTAAKLAAEHSVSEATVKRAMVANGLRPFYDAQAKERQVEAGKNYGKGAESKVVQKVAQADKSRETT